MANNPQAFFSELFTLVGAARQFNFGFTAEQIVVWNKDAANSYTLNPASPAHVIPPGACQVFPLEGSSVILNGTGSVQVLAFGGNQGALYFQLFQQLNTAGLTDAAVTALKLAIAALTGLGTALIGVPFIIEQDLGIGAGPVSIYAANAPFKFEVLDAWVRCQGNNAGGTATLDDGVTAITDAMICAVVGTMVHAGNVDYTKATLAAGASLRVLKNAATDRGTVFALCVRKA